MKKDLTEIVICLDRSGSMGPIRKDAIGGVNTFIEEQQKVKGDANFSLILFSSPEDYIKRDDRVDLKGIKFLTFDEYVPSGNTALYDAVGRTINDIGVSLNNTPEDQRPDKVIFVIMTDGEENSSQVFSSETLAGMISLQEQTYNWAFIYLGANQDAMLEAKKMGVGTSANYSVQNTGDSFIAASLYTTAYRSRGVKGTSADLQADYDNIVKKNGNP